VVRAAGPSRRSCQEGVFRAGIEGRLGLGRTGIGNGGACGLHHDELSTTRGTAVGGWQPEAGRRGPISDAQAIVGPPVF